MKQKPFWKSRTLWANGIAVLLLAVTDYQHLLPNDAQEKLVYWYFGLNIMLRLLTSDALTTGSTQLPGSDGDNSPQR